MNLFATVLTYTAPSANYRGESAQNRSVIQKITKGRHEYAIISPESMRNALRETLAGMGLPCNRKRLDDEGQPAVEFQDFPDSEAYADDFFLGWLVAAKPSKAKDADEDLKNAPEKLADSAKEKTRKGNAHTITKQEILASMIVAGRDIRKFTFKRDSIVRMNMAVALEPYRHDSVFTQSPQNAGTSPWKNTKESVLLYRETAVTAFQYPFALNLEECRSKSPWARQLLQAIGQLNSVAGNHARSYFEFAPASIVVRLTNQLVAGFDTYAFRIDEQGAHALPEIIDRILDDDLPGQEFYLGGKVVRDARNIAVKDASEENQKQTASLLDKLREKGVTAEPNPQRLLETVAKKAFPEDQAEE